MVADMAARKRWCERNLRRQRGSGPARSGESAGAAAHARSESLPAPTPSLAGLGESTWSVERQRADSAPYGWDVIGAGGHSGGVVRRAPRWEGRGQETTQELLCEPVGLQDN
jgi:hypothetical protein